MSSNREICAATRLPRPIANSRVNPAKETLDRSELNSGRRRLALLLRNRLDRSSNRRARKRTYSVPNRMLNTTTCIARHLARLKRSSIVKRRRNPFRSPRNPRHRIDHRPTITIATRTIIARKTDDVLCGRRRLMSHVRNALIDARPGWRA
jgi:hypothetical protein